MTRWEVPGPLEKSKDHVARDHDTKGNSWRPFATDERGAVITGMITDYQGPRTVAYFRTRFQHDKDEELFLRISTVDDLAMWVNGRFRWFIPRDDYIWFDFWKNPEHAGQRIPIPLRKGENQIVLRAVGVSMLQVDSMRVWKLRSDKAPFPVYSLAFTVRNVKS